MFSDLINTNSVQYIIYIFKQTVTCFSPYLYSCDNLQTVQIDLMYV